MPFIQRSTDQVKATRAWRLSGLVAARCADSERLRACWAATGVRRTACRLAAWLELAGGLGVAGEDDHAVLCLSPPRRRDRARLFGLVAATALVVVACFIVGIVVWWPLAIPAVVLWAMVMVPAVPFSWRCRPGDRVLRAVRPPHGWYLHSFASAPLHPGAGRALLAVVCAEADRRGRVLYLDTSAERLVEYYREFGFDVAAEASMAVRGAAWTVRRMSRQPTHGAGLVIGVEQTGACSDR